MSDLTVPFETQNVHDDDAAVIDSFFVETDTPPDLKPAAETVPSPAVELPKKTTRILTRSDLIDPTWGPTLLFPPDPNRKSMTVNVYSPTSVATDGVRIFSDMGDQRSAGLVLHNQTPMSDMLGDHTGPVYVVGAALGGPGTLASAAVWVFAWTVTE